MRRQKAGRRKLFQFVMPPRINPVEKAKEMIAIFGAEKALSIALGLSKGIINAISNREIIEFTCKADLTRGNGLWQSVAGYAKKQVEKEQQAKK